MEYLQGELVKAKQTKEPIEVKVQHCTRWAGPAVPLADSACLRHLILRLFSFTIEKVLEWLEDHAEDAPYDETTYQPDVTIFGEASEADVVQFMYAAEQFGIKPLIHTAAAKLAEFMNANPNPEKLKEVSGSRLFAGSNFLTSCGPAL